jgi:hypothetical protein
MALSYSSTEMCSARGRTPLVTAAAAGRLIEARTCLIDDQGASRHYMRFSAVKRFQSALIMPFGITGNLTDVAIEIAH